jgi:predicted aspartyl protease
MIPYNRSIDPPAPFVQVTVRHPTTDQQVTLSAKLDTGADISGIPQRVVDDLELVALRSIYVEGYDNVCVPLATYLITLQIADTRFRHIEVVPLPEELILLGRDVLNYFYARLNGPELTFDLSLSPLE